MDPIRVDSVDAEELNDETHSRAENLTRQFRLFAIVLLIAAVIGWLVYDSLPYFADKRALSEKVLKIATDYKGSWNDTKRYLEARGYIIFPPGPRATMPTSVQYWGYVMQRKPLSYQLYVATTKQLQIEFAKTWSPMVCSLILRGQTIEGVILAGDRRPTKVPSAPAR